MVWVSHSSMVFWVQNEAKGAVEFMGLEKGEREGKMAVSGSLGGRAALTGFSLWQPYSTFSRFFFFFFYVLTDFSPYSL